MFVLDLKVFDAPEAALRRRPYSVGVHTSDATAEQLVSAVQLLKATAMRIEKMCEERYPGALASYQRGDKVLKYGTGDVTGVEDSEGNRVPPRDDYEEDEAPDADR